MTPAPAFAILIGANQLRSEIVPQDIQLLTAKVQAGRYITPSVLEATGMVLPGEEGGPIRIHLILEDGYELELPVTQDAMEHLHHLTGGQLLVRRVMIAI